MPIGVSAARLPAAAAARTASPIPSTGSWVSMLMATEASSRDRASPGCFDEREQHGEPAGRAVVDADRASAERSQVEL